MSNNNNMSIIENGSVPLDSLSFTSESSRSNSDKSTSIEIPANSTRKRLDSHTSRLLIENQDHPQPSGHVGYHSFKDLAFLSITSLGIIFGDIGTSVLYVFSSMFTKNEVNPDNVIGAVSLIVWALFITVCFKYVIFILSADNNGEGGILSLQSLLSTSKAPKNIKLVLSCVAIIGSALTLGDGIITPSISVLSAIEGLEVGVPGKLNSWIMPIALVILFILFMCQRFGTETIGQLFGPIMLLWFVAIALSGINQIRYHPEVFKAFNPWEGLRYIGKNNESILVLGFVILSVTGCEALFADLGHFGVAPIRISWFLVVLPSLIFNYLGQASYYLEKGSSVKNPFYEMLPKGVLWPMIVLATMATVIASQSLVTGSFSIINQAIHLNYFPLVKVKHTSEKIIGQIYIAEVNYILMILTLIVVVGFGHSSKLIDAYGLGVSFVMVLTTILYLFVQYYKYEAPIWKMLLLGSSFLIVDIAYFIACITKVPTGGWLPIVVATGISSIMLIWRFGREEMMEAINNRSIPLANVLLKGIDLTNRLVSTGGVFMQVHNERSPTALIKLLPLLKSNIPYPLLFISINQLPIPFITEQHRVICNELMEGKAIYDIEIKYGYSEVINIPKVVNDLVSTNIIKTSFNNSPNNINSSRYNFTYFLSKERVTPSQNRNIFSKLYIYIFDVLLRNSRSDADYYGIYFESIMDVGTKLEI